MLLLMRPSFSSDGGPTPPVIPVYDGDYVDKYIYPKLLKKKKELEAEEIFSLKQDTVIDDAFERAKEIKTDIVEAKEQSVDVESIAKNIAARKAKAIIDENLRLAKVKLEQERIAKVRKEEERLARVRAEENRLEQLAIAAKAKAEEVRQAKIKELQRIEDERIKLEAKIAKEQRSIALIDEIQDWADLIDEFDD
jgi:hypothetical protein